MDCYVCAVLSVTIRCCRLRRCRCCDVNSLRCKVFVVAKYGSLCFDMVFCCPCYDVLLLILPLVDVCAVTGCCMCRGVNCLRCQMFLVVIRGSLRFKVLLFVQ